MNAQSAQTPQPAPRAEYAAEFLSAENQPENMRRAALAAVNPPKNKRAAVMFKPNS
jgi:hypothetical protein